jgi:two-component system chemotaxis response regulator CheB
VVAQQRISQDLVPKIQSLCRVGAASAPTASAQGTPSVPKFFTRALGTPTRADVVAIGSSTGGPNAVAAVLSALPADFPASIMLVQHMPNMFTRFLAERLNTQTPLNVIEAEDGQVVQPGTVYVAPGDFHLTVRRQGTQIVTVLGQEPPEHSHRPAADALFRSVADVYGSRALGLVLTGMGEDGRRGSEEINRAGGRVVVQDEASSVVWEMAGRVARAGLADAVLPLNSLAGELVRRTGRSSTTAA